MDKEEIIKFREDLGNINLNEIRGGLANELVKLIIEVNEIIQLLNTRNIHFNSLELNGDRKFNKIKKSLEKRKDEQKNKT